MDANCHTGGHNGRAPSEVTWTEHQYDESRGHIGDDGRSGMMQGDPRPDEDSALVVAAAGQEPVTRDSVPKRDATHTWVNWQSALYVFALGATCLVLVPLTSFWWIVPVLGALVPITLAALDRPGLKIERPGARRLKEQELLSALTKRGELTPTTAAMRTSLTVDEASKMLEGLARKGHLRSRAEDGAIVYALHEGVRYETPGEVLESSRESESDGVLPRPGGSQRLEDPLSERELEVLKLLASGRTNTEVARDLFVSVGTVKSHTGNIYRKLGSKNRAEAISRARDLNLLQ